MRKPDDPVMSYRDKRGALHIATDSKGQPVNDYGKETGWGYAPGHAPNHKERR